MRVSAGTTTVRPGVGATFVPTSVDVGAGLGPEDSLAECGVRRRSSIAPHIPQKRWLAGFS
jgi:hypothetical protein